MTDPGTPHDERSSAAADRAMPAGLSAFDTAMLADEERLAEQRRSAIEAGRRTGGVAGAAMAGAMLAVNEIVEGPPKDDAPVTVEASGDPHDLERDGFGAIVGGTEVGAPPLAPMPPKLDRRKLPQL